MYGKSFFSIAVHENHVKIQAAGPFTAWERDGSARGGAEWSLPAAGVRRAVAGPTTRLLFFHGGSYVVSKAKKSGEGWGVIFLISLPCLHVHPVAMGGVRT